MEFHRTDGCIPLDGELRDGLADVAIVKVNKAMIPGMRRTFGN
jgi:hypothetical protein